MFIKQAAFRSHASWRISRRASKRPALGADGLPIPPNGDRKKRIGWLPTSLSVKAMYPSHDQPQLQPFVLKDAPALIEAVFPAQKVSFEAQRERKAGAGQTLTALGSYWKGRKPLILVRAILLGSLLPQTDDPEPDLEIFERLMGFDLGGLALAANARVSPSRRPTIGSCSERRRRSTGDQGDTGRCALGITI